MSSTPEHAPEHAIVWAELPVRDFAKGQQFFTQIGFGPFTVLNDGPQPIAIFNNTDPHNNVSGHLYQGTPATPGQGPTIHFAAPADLATMATRVAAAGGHVLGDPVMIPQGQFLYCQDPDGNSIAFFTMGHAA